MELLVQIGFALLTVIHGLPAIGAVVSSKISGTYGVSTDDAVAMTLLQHRAVLFGILAAGSCAAVFRPELRIAVLIGAMVSMTAFLAIAIARGETRGTLRTIVIVDVIGIVVGLVTGGMLFAGI